MTRFIPLNHAGEALPAGTTGAHGIHDAQLNLEWLGKSLKAKNHADAMAQCEALGDGWRAPTIDELASLVDRTRSNPACDPVLNMPTDDWHWSSSPLVGAGVAYAWYVDFGDGAVGGDHRDYDGFVRPVRVASPRQ